MRARCASANSGITIVMLIDQSLREDGQGLRLGHSPQIDLWPQLKSSAKHYATLYPAPPGASSTMHAHMERD